MEKTIAVLNGPNLDRLGKREPEVYGTATLGDLESALQKEADRLGVGLRFFQSNFEGAMIEELARCADDGVSGLILNLGAWTHTSIALRDALAGTGLPAVEVHISNLYKREGFRHHSYLAPVCAGIISGLGFEGYHAALRFLAK